MKPVNVSAFGTVGDLAAAAKIAFGAAVMRSASGTLKAPSALVHNIIGVADWDLVEKTEDGFYSAYDIVPVLAGAVVRLWVTSNNLAKEDIEAGDNLELADVGSSNLLPVGAFQQMTADGTESGAVREAGTLARALEDVTLTNIEPVEADVAVGATTVTMTAANMTLLGLAAGDYILLEDKSDQCMINRVKSVTATVITLQMASTVALTKTTEEDPIHKLHQVEAILI
jgi:hypothetical protein